MGAKLGTPKSSTRDQAPSKSILSSYDDHHSVIELLKPDCMKPKKRRRRKEQKNAKIVLKRRVTLEDWIMASPSTEPESFYGGELYVFKQHKKAYTRPCSSSSLSIDRRRDKVMVNSSSKRNKNKKDDDDYGEEEFYSIAVVSSLSTISESEKSKKKVRFRSPRESDIILFYSPKDRFVGHEKLVRCK